MGANGAGKSALIRCLTAAPLCFFIVLQSIFALLKERKK